MYRRSTASAIRPNFFDSVGQAQVDHRTDAEPFERALVVGAELREGVRAEEPSDPYVHGRSTVPAPPTSRKLSRELNVAVA